LRGVIDNRNFSRVMPRPSAPSHEALRASRWGLPLFRLLALLAVLGCNLFVLFDGKYLDLLTIDIVLIAWALIASKRDLLRLSPVIMYAFLFTVSIYAGNLIVYLGYIPMSEGVFDPKLWDTSLALLAFSCGAYVVPFLRKSPGVDWARSRVRLSLKQLPYLYLMYGLILSIIGAIILHYGLPSIHDVEGRIEFTGHLGYAAFLITCFLPLFSSALIAILTARGHKKKAILIYLLYMIPFVLLRITREFVFFSLLPLMLLLRLNIGFSVSMKRRGAYMKYFKIGAACIALLVAALFLRAVAYGRTEKLSSVKFVTDQAVGRIVIAEAGAFSAIASGGWNSRMMGGGASSFLIGLLPFAPNDAGDLMHSLALSTRAGPVGIRDWGTLPPTLIGDFYLIGGSFAVLVGSFLYGVLLRMIDIAIDHRVRTLGGLIIMCYLAIGASKVCLTGMTLGAREAWRVAAVWLIFMYIPAVIARGAPIRTSAPITPLNSAR
jgi:oligosaccharide repeat unit polymerase